MTDQHRGDCLGCAGHPVLETPYLDELAGRGVRFEHAHTAVPSCIPARASLLTGMDQWHTGILGMGAGAPRMRSDYLYTLPGELAKAGYHTCGVGKMHFNPQRALNGFHSTILDESGRVESSGFVSDYRSWFEEHKTGSYGYRDHSVGWNSWMARPSHLPEWLHPTHWTAEQAIRWLKRRDPEKPFFLKVSFARPHSPYDPPQVYYDMYRHREIPPPAVGDWAGIHDRPSDAVRTEAWRGRRRPEEVRRARAAYYGSITFIDHQIGRVLYELQKMDSQALSNTLIMFISDHGDMLGDHNLWRKTYAYEGSSRIPFILCPPRSWRIPGGRVLPQVVELRDVMPTLLDAAGLEIPPTCDGQSLLPLLRGESVSWREYLHGEHCTCYSPEQEMQYLTDGRRKYIWFPNLESEQFFDLTEDPTECQDLASEPSRATEVASWRSRLVEILAARDCGLVRDGRLVSRGETRAVVPPHYGKYGCRGGTEH